MTRPHPRGMVAAAVAATVALACSSASPAPAPTPQPAPPPAAAPAVTPTTVNLDVPIVQKPTLSPGALSQAIAQAKRDSLARPWTAADVEFISGMIPHHSQAIAMARLAPGRHQDPAIGRLAARIINAQLDEINVMQAWLRDRQLPVPEAMPMGMVHKMDGMNHQMLMPGMLTREQMQELEAARGKDFDRLFLTYMIRHHQGAIAMVKTLIGSPAAAQDEFVFKFSADVNTDQSTEVARMERMLFAQAIGEKMP
jgi:uncharacterized protein (DUF305 family)